MAEPIVLPDPSVPLVGPGGRPTDDWFPILKLWALAYNQQVATVADNKDAADASIAALQALITAAQAAITALQSAVTTLQGLTGSTTYDPPNLNDGVGATTTVTVTGAALGDIAQASFSLDLQGITLTAWVSSANTVSVRFQNESGGAINLASGTLKAQVHQ